MVGHVNGMLVDAGSGAGRGCPALVLDRAGAAVGVDVFESVDLSARVVALRASFSVDGRFGLLVAVSARRARGFEKGEHGHNPAIHLPFLG